MRIFFATDLHGSDICFKKFLKAREFYKADVVVLGGDLCAGSVVFAEPSGTGWKVKLGDRDVLVSGQQELEKFRAFLADSGRILKISGDHRAWTTQEFTEEFQLQLGQWSELASRQSAGHLIYFVPGNDDPPYLDDIFSPPFVNIHARHFMLDEHVSIMGVGGSTQTPWKTEREYSEDELRSFIAGAYDPALRNRPLILVAHCPPFGTGLDSAPALLQDFKYELHLGTPRYVPVGSHAVREAIDNLAPILGLFGHVHEARRQVKLNRTLCINPGSAAWTGRLQGCIVDIIGGRVADFQLTEG